MGLLKAIGKPLTWEESAEYRAYVREHGVTQFLNTYNRVKDSCCEELLWGDELEYGIFAVDSVERTIKLSCRGPELLQILAEKELTSAHRCEGCTWHPEYGGWMVEATPKQPFAGYAADLLRVERNMRLRRKRMLSVLAPDEIAPTVTVLPIMGALPPSELSRPAFDSVRGPIANSQFVPDGIINSHPRFAALTANIRARRGSNVDIQVPLFRDVRTAEFATHPPPLDTPVSSPVVVLTKATFGNSSRAERAAAVATAAAEEVIRTVPSPTRPAEGSSSTSSAFGVGNGSNTSAAADEIRQLVASAEKAQAPGGVPLEQQAKQQQQRMRELSIAEDGDEADGGSSSSSYSGSASPPLLPGLRLVGRSDDVPPPPPSVPGEPKGGRPPAPTVAMDAMAFGMGCCCLQVTFQGRDIDESRFMYDQLAVLSPIMLALSAATPILRGRVVDTDVRWAVIAGSVDDRNPVERGEQSAEGVAEDPTLAGGGVRRLLKSRYDSISTYLHYCKRRADNPMHVLDTYNDIPCEIHAPAKEFLLANGVDPALSHHIAHLFTRDPLVIFQGAVSEVDDAEETDHFENIQSTNWQTVRWKPPPPRSKPEDPKIGWRTEFRSMEVQLTDLENAAFTVFVVLVTRVILAFDLNLYIPLSKVDENMQRAHKRGAVTSQRFFWRQHMAPPDSGSDEADAAAAAVASSRSNGYAGDARPPQRRRSTEPPHDHSQDQDHAHDHEHNSCHQEDTGFEEMTIHEIMMGKGDYYPGLIPLVYAYLEHIGCDAETADRVHQYLELLRQRSAGELPTAAAWMRGFVSAHPEYACDSVVTPGIAHDLMLECCAIGEGRRACPSLLGDLRIRPVLPETGYDVLLNSAKVGTVKARSLIAKYRNRTEWNESARTTRQDTKQRAKLSEKLVERLRAEREPSISFY